MAGCGINRLRHACCRPVAPAIVRRAQVGTTFHYLARDRDFWITGIEALVALATPGIEAGAACLRQLVMLLIPVRGPFPNIAGHLVKAIAIWWEGSHGRRPFISIS